MNLFADYVQPLTQWLQENPNWFLFITFFISLTESLAIIGSIIPGSLSMTAIGILAGSGIMRIDLTLCAAILGAISGDSLSYGLGFFYSEQLVSVWPFKKYPHWLLYGKDFFHRHGGKSVLIGRFFGPLRSIIPVIAGMMRMNQLRFLMANSISAIGWSVLYVMPGVLIGAAGHELSTESATRLFIVILLILAAIWIIGLVIKWSLIQINSFLRPTLHSFWLTLKDHRVSRKFYNLFTPLNEESHYHTAGLVLATVSTFLISIFIIRLNVENQLLPSFNIPTHLFIQSFHTSLFEAIFIICSQLTSVLTMTTVYVLCCIWFIYDRNLKTILFLSTLIILSILIAYALSYTIYSPRPTGLLITMKGNSFPNSNLLVATSFYGFIIYYVNHKYSLLTNSLRSFILITLGFSGFSSIYLGDYWLSDVIGAYFIGATLSLVHCLIYRKYNRFNELDDHSAMMLLSLFFCIVCSSFISAYYNFSTLVHAHTQYHKEFSLNKAVWWNQRKPILPLYYLNRLGKKESLLNVQYLGGLNEFRHSLESIGWRVHSETMFNKILMLIGAATTNEVRLPLLAQLYDNKRPELIMSYKVPNTHIVFELTVWESNYSISQQYNPLWIGTVHQSAHKYNSEVTFSKTINPLTYMIPALNQYTLRKIDLSNSGLANTYYPSQPSILLVNQPDITY